MKKTALLLVLALALVFTGCSSSEGGKETPDTAQAEKEETGQSEEKAEAFSGKYIVDAAYVKENIDNIVLIDARGDEKAETIKGAVPVMWQYLATCEDGVSGDENWGCILDTKRLSERLGEKGFDKNKEIVLFAASQNGWGDDGRIAWELIAAGYDKVKMVDGGFPALKDAGLETQKGGSEPETVKVAVDKIDETHIINTDELKADYDNYKVVDVRADEEYNGEILYGEANGGHLPGAIHIRFTDLFNEDGTLKSNSDITGMFEDAGLSKKDQIVTYCTAGIRSGYMQLVLEMCGFENSKNYDESFYRWCAVEKLEK